MTRRTVLAPAALALASLVGCAAALVASLAVPERALAAYPGQNGEIVYVKDPCGEGCTELYAKKVGDASSVALTDDNQSNVNPSYAYGGERIVYVRYPDIVAVPSSGGDPEVLLSADGTHTLSHPSLSPDGGTLLYESFDRDTRESALYAAPVSGGAPKLIIGRDGGYYGFPEWSPDGRRISYAGTGGLFAVPASGGAPVLVTDLSSEGPHSWSPDGSRVAFVGFDAERGGDVLYTVPASGGSPEAVYGVPREALPRGAGIRSLAYSPDGRYIAFSAYGLDPSDGSEEIFVVPSGGGTPEQITHNRYSVGQPDWQPVCPCPAPPPTDMTDPTVARPRPAPGAEVRDRTPTIRAIVRDETSELSASDVGLRVDGERRAFSYDAGTDRLTRAKGRLSYGRHRVEVSATDAAGNEATRSWTFRVVRR